MSTRIAIVADIHHGTASHTKMGGHALPLLERFAKWSNAEKPDLVLDLGDRISDVDEPTDLQLEAEVAEALRALDAPVYHICGNHDRDHLSVAQNEELLGQTLGSDVIDLGAWQLALWRAETKIDRRSDRQGFTLPEPDLLWLSRMAQSASVPTLVVSHVPVSGHSQIGNYYFQRNPEVATYPEAERVRAALEQARVPMFVLSGHVHWNGLCQVNGIWHLTQQSLTESFTTQGRPAEAWGALTLNDAVHWQVHGEDPFEARLTPMAGRWTPPLGPF